ncbi:MAG: hypothetical protein H7222_04260 [Methylotenera sp.]|nr:hypothetical protein [Oligoflexia bacterium]
MNMPPWLYDPVACTLFELFESLRPFMPDPGTLMSYHEWMCWNLDSGTGPLIARLFGGHARGEDYSFTQADRGVLQTFPCGSRPLYISDNEALASIHAIAMRGLVLRGDFEANIDHQRIDRDMIWIHGSNAHIYPHPLRSQFRVKLAHILDASKGIQAADFATFEAEAKVRCFRSLTLLNVFPFPNESGRNEWYEVKCLSVVLQDRRAGEDRRVRLAMAAFVYFEVLGGFEHRESLWRDYRRRGADDLGLDPENLKDSFEWARGAKFSIKRIQRAEVTPLPVLNHGPRRALVQINPPTNVSPIEGLNRIELVCNGSGNLDLRNFGSRLMEPFVLSYTSGPASWSFSIANLKIVDLFTRLNRTRPEYLNNRYSFTDYIKVIVTSSEIELIGDTRVLKRTLEAAVREKRVTFNDSQGRRLRCGDAVLPQKAA